MPSFKLIAPLRLNPAVRDALSAAIVSMNGDARAADAITVSAGIRKFGISKEQLGVVAHGLRHEHVSDAYESDADEPSPVRGGVTRPAKDQEARQRAARLLGHNRPGVTSCYLGRSPAAVAAERPPSTDAVIDPKA